ncbi:MAG: hypothetical protein JSU94_08085 [Phycisphaerales bacterium]|nr:MAG: hypothetical protein JSU94_08085 [Phycisphaerales bacterium]
MSKRYAGMFRAWARGLAVLCLWAIVVLELGFLVGYFCWYQPKVEREACPFGRGTEGTAGAGPSEAGVQAYMRYVQSGRRPDLVELHSEGQVIGGE